MKRVAILDLGTNTFNLLIVEQNSKGEQNIIINHRLPVKLGEGRINNGEISEAAFARGINAVTTHYEAIMANNVDAIKAFGTSALRTAKNGPDFVRQFKNITHTELEVISGDREAELIYLGVRQTLNIDNQFFAVLDIGGGSNEFIIANMNEIIWKKSYPLGVARLLEKFNPSDPISELEIKNILEYLSENLNDLFLVLKNHKIEILVGASGSFETFIAMIEEHEICETECGLKEISTEITIEQYNKLYHKLIYSTGIQRKTMKGLEPMRIEMIVLACLFVKYILENHTFTRIIQSNFALKEGAAYELFNL